MKLLIKKASLRRTLKFVRNTLFATSAVAILYCGFVFLDTWNFNDQPSLQLALQPDASLPAKQTVPSTPGIIGRMKVERLGISVVVAEGTSNATLLHAVGHIEGTPLPGQPGNVGISGHRDTFFRPLRNIRKNDVIQLTTLVGEYRYRVISTKIVSPKEISVLDPSTQEILTLVTCYPFYFIGAAPDRFIVRAERVT